MIHLHAGRSVPAATIDTRLLRRPRRRGAGSPFCAHRWPRMRASRVRRARLSTSRTRRRHRADRAGNKTIDLAICAIVRFAWRMKNGAKRMERSRKRVTLTRLVRGLAGPSSRVVTASPRVLWRKRPGAGARVLRGFVPGRCRPPLGWGLPRSAPRPGLPAGTPQKSSGRPRWR